MTGPEGWRWLFWVLAIFGGTSTIVLFFTLPETYAPIILRDNAIKIRKETGDRVVYAAIEQEDRRILKLLKITLSRPFQLLFGDIIVFLVCLYLSFCYGVQYLFFQVCSCQVMANAGVSNHLPRCAPFEPWGRRISVCCRRRRLRHWVYWISILGLSTTTSKAEIAGRLILSRGQDNVRTSASTNHDDCRAIFYHRIFLARLDGLSVNTGHSADVVRSMVWGGKFIPVFWILQLLDRLLLLCS
jgi:MFS family permease